MDFKKLCESRYSVRNYLQKNIEQEKLNYILECAQLAPSAANNQPWQLFVTTENTNDRIRKAIASSYHRDWFRTAPVHIIFCKNKNQSWKRTGTDAKDHGDVDIAIMADHLSLATTSIGLGSCWICNFDPTLLSQALDLPPHIEPVVIFSLGYIDEENSPIPIKKRKSLDEIVTWL